MSDLTPEAKELLSRYVTNLDGPVFVLRNLPEEVVAVLFAYYSRSRADLRSNLLRLIQDEELDLEFGAPVSAADDSQLSLAREKARQFHEKWVVGYGHASVAEHAVAHVAIEDVSIIASKVIEDARLAAFTEKSTRYVRFEPGAFYCLSDLEASAAVEDAVATLRFLFETYSSLFDPVMERVRSSHPRGEDQTEGAWTAACRAETCDVLRYLLPAATHTNIGLTANARTLEHLISRMLSHPLAEVRRTGQLVKQEAAVVIPTLIKYADEQPYLRDTPAALAQAADGPFAGAPQPSADVALVRWPEDAEELLAAALAYEVGQGPWEQVRARVAQLGPAWQRSLIAESLKRRGPHDQPLRVFEHLYYTFDILVDYGAFRDLQRHRMATQTTQLLTTEHGYSVPEALEAYGFGARFEESMERADRSYRRLAAEFPNEAQYVVPLAYRKRVLFTWNLRELHHFIPLRSSRQGHASYRRIAQQVFRELERVHPFLASFIRVDLTERELARS
jgi:thymidylate synthase ThyX